ncbi:ABC-type sugar transport system, substrate-binding protein, contains N-terminal xre family HTH domain [Jiangella alkaliphila]|uniref:ABC-type sugar transport system, substrate-binding protein, contains N-terminal xre family HTH domain n=1 Tax=Jiangella alkaliphila TaxID=419479 RepID=A0A1H2G011_9ACTN|nr:ABC-type sugar transport system, substrate-binding protein, contains N-terminal xre family HTH domain [Jiangella alkaliphila]
MLRSTRTLVSLTSVTVIALGLGGCQAADQPAETAGSPDPASLSSAAPSVDAFQADGFTIGIANYSLATPYLAALNTAMEDRAAEVGVTAISTDAGGDPAQLAADVTDLLAQEVDGIIVSGGDLVNAPGVSLAMKDSQVSLVFVDRLFDSGFYNAWIGPDYSTIAWDSCDYIGSALGGRGKVATIKGGPASHPIGLLLAESFGECFAQTLPEMSLVESGELGDWTEAGGERVMNSLLAEHGDLVAVFCQNDAMCLGAQKAAADAGRTDEMIFVGVGGTPEAFEAIMAGSNFNATSLVDPDEIGEQGVNLMVTIFRREDFARNSFVPSPLVRPGNAAEYQE